MSLTRDQILAKRLDLPRKPVDVPGLGGTVFVRVLSLAETVALIDRNNTLEAGGQSHKSLAVMVTACACDEAGAALFTADDEDALLGLPVADLKAVADAGMAINRMGDEPFEAARKN